MNFKKKIRDFVDLCESAIIAEEKAKKEEITKEEFDIIRECHDKVMRAFVSLGVIVTIALIIIAFACQITLPLKIWLTLFVIGCTPTRSKYTLKREEKEDRYEIIDIRDSWK